MPVSVFDQFIVTHGSPATVYSATQSPLLTTAALLSNARREQGLGGGRGEALTLFLPSDARSKARAGCVVNVPASVYPWFLIVRVWQVTVPPTLATPGVQLTVLPLSTQLYGATRTDASDGQQQFHAVLTTALTRAGISKFINPLMNSPDTGLPIEAITAYVPLGNPLALNSYVWADGVLFLVQTGTHAYADGIPYGYDYQLNEIVGATMV